MNVENEFASRVTEEMSQSKGCHRLGRSFRKEGQDVGEDQVLESEIKGF